MMHHVILSGAGGQLGKAFLKLLSFEQGYSVFSFDKQQLDIADRDKVHRVLDSLPNVKYWINCAAYTKVDDAEKYPEQAFLYNTTAPGYIAEACLQRGVHLIHFSSDYIYHNDLRRPLREDDPAEPKGVYAKSKWEGEQLIRSIGVDHTILRTSWVYGPGGHNFVNTMLRLGKIKDELTIVDDQLGAPTFTFDIVRCVKDLIELPAEQHAVRPSLFNFANQGEVTWDNFAQKIFELTRLSCKVISISTEAYGAPAPRPRYSVLDCERIRPYLSSDIPSWEDALAQYLSIV